MARRFRFVESAGFFLCAKRVKVKKPTENRRNSRYMAVLQAIPVE
jgi:hypothetical protein